MCRARFPFGGAFALADSNESNRVWGASAIRRPARSHSGISFSPHASEEISPDQSQSLLPHQPIHRKPREDVLRVVVLVSILSEEFVEIEDRREPVLITGISSWARGDKNAFAVRVYVELKPVWGSGQEQRFLRVNPRYLIPNSE